MRQRDITDLSLLDTSVADSIDVESDIQLYIQSTTNYPPETMKIEFEEYIPESIVDISYDFTTMYESYAPKAICPAFQEIVDKIWQD